MQMEADTEKAKEKAYQKVQSPDNLRLLSRLHLLITSLGERNCDPTYNSDRRGTLVVTLEG